MSKLETYKQSWGTRYLFYCPGCKDPHIFDVRNDDKHPSWNFNGDLQNPTVSPSILITGVHRCHLYLVDSHIQYLSDCSHDLAGKTIPLEDRESHFI